MTGDINSVTLHALSSALDMAVLRQQVIATNIANANTPGYAAKRLTFAQVFESQSFAGASRSGQSATDVSFDAPRPTIETHLDANGQPQPVQLDQEVAALSENSLHYQVLLKGLGRQLAMLNSAVSEGKR